MTSTHSTPSDFSAESSVEPSAEHAEHKSTEAPHRKRRKVRRTRKGCLTCRKRRKLCDLERPLCGACVRLKLDCEWPPEIGSSHASSLTIVSSTPSSSQLGSGHRHVSALPSVSVHPSISPTISGASNSFFSIPPASQNPPTPWPTASMNDLMGIFGDNGGEGAAHLGRNGSNGQPNGSSTQPLPTSTNQQNPQGRRPQQDIPNGSGTNLFNPYGSGPTQTPPFSGFNLNGQDNAVLADPLTSILDGMNFDEATLQLWAAGCLAMPTPQTVDPFQSLSDLLRPAPEGAFSAAAPGIQPPVNAVSSTDPLQTFTDSTTHPNPSVRPASRQVSPSAASPHHAHLLKHYQASLSSLVSCTGDTETAPSAFAAFTKLAEASSSSEAGQGLHLSILAWAGRHMVNQGQVKYESVSERLGEKAMRIVLAKLEEWKRGSSEIMGENERMTLLAGALMIVQFKICRGDVWGYETLLGYLKSLSNSLYQVDSPGAPPDSMPFSFFENLVYHDLLSSMAYSNGPLVPYSVLWTYSNSSSDYLHTLTGACFPLFCKMHRIATLATQRRLKAKKRAGGTLAHQGVATTLNTIWTDEELYDLVLAADEVEQQLKEEKKQMEALVKGKPSLASHRFLHEAYRIACLMSLHSFVFCEPPTSLRIQLLVRQSLSLLEEMYEKNLPGFCSAHWVLFVTALCCYPDANLAEKEKERDEVDGEKSDCQRIEKLYDVMSNDFAFGNVKRSRKVYTEVWNQNQGGRIFVDWVDVVDEFDWELFLV